MECTIDWTPLAQWVDHARTMGRAPHDLDPVQAALAQAGENLANTWEAVAGGVAIPGLTRAVHDPAYAASITARQLGQLAVEVGSTDPRRDARAQAYAAPWDMKPGLLGGPHARTTRARAGQPAHRYNVIPFAHAAEQVSTAALWALVQNHPRFDPADVPRRAQFTPVGVYVHQTAPEAGIRWGRTGPVTFRTVSDRSPAASWWYPSRPANPIAASVWSLWADAVTADVVAAWQTALGGSRHDQPR